MSDEVQRAFVSALKMLGRRDYFEQELKRKLGMRDHPADAVDAAIDRCREMGYLDDRRYAVRFVELRAADRGWGPSRARAELRARGVKDSITEIAARLPASLHERALATALRKAEVRATAFWWRGRAGSVRMISSLLRRGFEPQEARRAVEGLAAEREATDNEENDKQGDS